MRVSYAIVFVSDMQRSVSFYRDALGLPLRFQSPGWSEFDSGGATLALHPCDSPAAREDRDGAAPPGRCHPGFVVDDLDRFHRRVLARGMRCIEAPNDLHGTRLAQYLDPDGLPLSVSEVRKS